MYANYRFIVISTYREKVKTLIVLRIELDNFIFTKVNA